MNKPRLAVSILLLLPFAGSACTPAAGDDASIAEAVVGGTFEPNAQFPWEVSLNGCHGVLIDPQWVLTAAHCVTEGVWGGHVSYSRTDPYTGTVHADSRTVSPGYGAVYINDGYVAGGGFDSPIDDIALVRLPSPFTIDPYIQTVAIPGTPRVIGTTGAIAGGSHNGTPPPGYDAVMRTTIPSTNPSTCAPPAGAFCISSTTASLCPGDSGSGFVTVENGRAVVRGIASFMNSASSCQSIGPYDYAALTDVYSFHDWILATMRLSDATLAGNTRVHAAGRTARGVVGLGCTNPYGTMYAPTNVVGTQVGADCEAGDTESVVCSISPGQTAGILAQPIVITGLTMKTTTSAGLITTTALPVTSTFASYYGFLPAGVTREFTCQIGLGRLTANGGALAR